MINNIITDTNMKVTIDINISKGIFELWLGNCLTYYVILHKHDVTLIKRSVFINNLMFDSAFFNAEQIKYLERFI